MNKYPNADTSPERLAEIEKFWFAAETNVFHKPTPMIRDLLAMLQERAWLDTHEICHCALSGEVHLNEKGKSCEICDGGCKITPVNVHNAIARVTNQMNDLRQQLHDQRWRRQSVDGMPEVGVPVQVRLRGMMDHARLTQVEFGGYMYQSQDGNRYSAELKGKADEIWWRPIPPLPKE